MKKGLFSKILDFYGENFAEVFEEARLEFYGGWEMLEKFYNDKQVAVMFLEWFVFDYKMANGRSPLENYLKEKFDNLSEEEILAGNDLLDNEYGFFLVSNVEPGRGIVLQSLNTGRRYGVKEKRGSKNVVENQIMVARVGKVDNHWEIVGGSGFVLAGFRFDKGVIEGWQKGEQKKFTPRDFFREFYLNDKKDEYSDNESSLVGRKSVNNYVGNINPKRAKRKFQHFLKKHNLDKYLSVETVQEWFYDLGLEDSKSPFKIMSDIVFVFYSLLDDVDMNEYVINELLTLLEMLHNTTPLKRLGGKTPKEMVEDGLSNNDESQVEIATREFNLKAVDNFNKAIGFMREGKIEKARKITRKGLKELYKNRLVYKESFRVFANLASIYVARDNLKGAGQLIDMALSLNPNYSFGRKLKCDVERIKKEIVENERKKQGNSEIVWEDVLSSRDRLLGKNRPEVKYYDFLKKTKINFSTEETTG